MRRRLYDIPPDDLAIQVTVQLCTPDAPLVRLGVIRRDCHSTMLTSPPTLPWFARNLIRRKGGVVWFRMRPCKLVAREVNGRDEGGAYIRCEYAPKQENFAYHSDAGTECNGSMR